MFPQKDSSKKKKALPLKDLNKGRRIEGTKGHGKRGRTKKSADPQTVGVGGARKAHSAATSIVQARCATCIRGPPKAGIY